MLHLAMTLESSPTAAGFSADADQWPCHATVLQSFRVDASIDEVRSVVAARAEGSGPVALVGDHVEGFGPRRDIPVTVLGRTDRLVALHNALLTDLAALQGFAPDVPEWAGEGYRPHVTAGTWGELAPGEGITFDHVAVVDVDAPQGRPVVLAVLPLRSSPASRL